MLNVPDKRLALQAYEQILDEVLGARIQPGELLNERRLAEVLNMSRTPVRDALLMLEAEGLLLRQGRIGLQVKQMRIEDYMDALQVRLLLEPEVARLAAGRLAPDVITAITDQLNDILAQAGGGASLVDRGLVRDADEALHGALAEAAGNPQMAQIIRNLRRQTLMFDLRSVPERVDDTCHEHLAIVAAVRDGDGDRAAREMAAHLGRVRDSIIQRLSRR
ncbi:GntR family transcriptional regulator [Falsirhodobacter sp. 20TX0035]|uniref:GntR family transcriptional regulator n=1 Tax=Falsirhodobacter sp. 20TX0035 TaxID=3022019 RepID=UPI00232E657D|nr:GntR family transcriptional regulator [Falsirhodobacter sp. 20TX0035]MDB6454206.1 GntR family transcriptional regulator [Falsirhodobacter sp. 20TX0035]